MSSQLVVKNREKKIPSEKGHLHSNVLIVCMPRVARWLVFKQKIPIWVNFGGPLNGNVGIFYDH
jgi:hypothetical protein